MALGDEEYPGQDSKRLKRSPRRTVDGVYVHLYGKTESRPERKMGHLPLSVWMPGNACRSEWAERFVK